MFYIGSNIVSYPLQAQRALADGHEICLRKCSFFSLFASPADASPDTWSHPRSLFPLLYPGRLYSPSVQ